MLAEATVVHALEGRVRLRFENQRRDAAFFERVERGLTGVAGVVEVQTNPVTGSVLVTFEQNADVVFRCAEQENLFRVVSKSEKRRTGRTETPEDPPWMALFDEVVRLDRRLRNESHDRSGVGVFTVYGMLAACGLQIYRGNYFPAASTLLMQATGILRELNKGRPGGKG